MKGLSDRLLHPWLTLRVQMALGAIFVAAAIPKISDPPAFAHMIYNYRLLPEDAINLMALILPWFELLVGLALILGIWLRTGAFLVGVLLLVFLGAIGINIARDNPVNCACFDVHAVEASRENLMTEMKWVAVRDIAMLLMVTQVLVAARASKRSSYTLQTRPK